MLEYWSNSIADLSFGLPPFGRVPGLGMRIVDFKVSFWYEMYLFHYEIRNPQSKINPTPLLYHSEE